MLLVNINYVCTINFLTILWAEIDNCKSAVVAFRRENVVLLAAVNGILILADVFNITLPTLYKKDDMYNNFLEWDNIWQFDSAFCVYYSILLTMIL